MSFYIPGLDDNTYRKNKIARETAEWELINFYMDLNEFEKQALKNIVVREGRKLELEHIKQELEKVRKDIVDLGGNYE